MEKTHSSMERFLVGYAGCFEEHGLVPRFGANRSMLWEPKVDFFNRSKATDGSLSLSLTWAKLDF